MVITDHYAYTVLGLPIGMDKDAISERYRQLCNKLSISKSSEDKKKLDQVYAAYNQLIPENQRINIMQLNNKYNGKAKSKITQNQHNLSNDLAYSSSSDEEYLVGHMLNQDKNEINDEKKSERKKNKKKKSKSKTKNNQLNNGTKIQNERNNESGSNIEEETIENEGIDHNSAFVTLVGKKFSANGTNSSYNLNGIRSDDTQRYAIKDSPLEARKFAMLGNEEANKGCYDKAVRLFSQAISCDSSDHRFFGNRSYCYDQLFQFHRALKDADKAIELSPEWPKGHFRKGRALKGLNRLTEAETSFENVLRYDESCHDAILEINIVRKRRIVEMGFTERQAKAAIKKYIEVQPALDALLTEGFRNALNDVIVSDDEEDIEPVRAMQTQQKDFKMNPKNPEGYTSLWVGNVVEDVTEKTLVKLFSKYGKVISVRLLRDKYCAFVNYSTKESAGVAMENLQNKTVSGSKLLIKFPNNPIANGQPNIILGKNKLLKNIGEENSAIEIKPEPTLDSDKARGPVNGNECYFWRTTGCIFNGSCKYLHIPEHKGIDKKTWQK